MSVKIRITVVSAHEGAVTWSKMIRHISESSRYELESFHQYDDVSYRSAVSRWQRLALRLQTFVVFPCRFLLHARRIARTSDFLLVVTSPFFMPVLASATIDARRTPLIALMNDIYPEALVAKGLIRRDGRGEKFLKKLFGAAFARMSALVFISEHHRQFVGGDIIGARSVVIPVSAHSDPFLDHRPAPPRDGIRVTYCGTLGLMHETGTFLSWLEHRGDRCGLRFSFHTSGAAKRRFESQVQALLAKPGLNIDVRLAGALPEQQWVQVMKDSQVGLVFQDSGAAKIIFPSKIAGILAAAQAVLVVAEPDSDIARLVSQNDCGWVVSPNDIAAFDASLREMLDPEALLNKRLNAFRLGQSMFGTASVARQWIALFDDLADSVAPRAA